MRSLRAAACLCLIVLPLASAQDEGFLRLGVDPQGDAKIQGQSHPDTMADVLFLDVKTDGDSLVFDLGLRGTTTEIGQFCPVAAFQVGSTEYLAFECFECVAYECTAAASDAAAPSSSRGANVASNVVFTSTAARITVPLASIKSTVGDTISDIYGLMYMTRALNVVDAAPDAKSSAGAADSFGEYIIGFGRPVEGPVAPVPATVWQDLEAPAAVHVFANATSDTYILNFTTDLANGTADFTWNATAGSVNATLVDANGTVAFTGVFDGNGSLSHPVAGAVPGTWNLTLAYDGFAGELRFDLIAVPDAPPEIEPSGDKNATAEGVDDAGDQKSPIPLLLPLFGLAVAGAMRRRRVP